MNNFNQGVDCGEPPARPGAGTWEWSGNYSYGTQISYTCGPYGKFCDVDGNCLEEVVGNLFKHSDCTIQK